MAPTVSRCECNSQRHVSHLSPFYSFYYYRPFLFFTLRVISFFRGEFSFFFQLRMIFQKKVESLKCLTAKAAGWRWRKHISQVVIETPPPPQIHLFNLLKSPCLGFFGFLNNSFFDNKPHQHWVNIIRHPLNIYLAAAGSDDGRIRVQSVGIRKTSYSFSLFLGGGKV